MALLPSFNPGPVIKDDWSVPSSDTHTQGDDYAAMEKMEKVIKEEGRIHRVQYANATIYGNETLVPLTVVTGTAPILYAAKCVWQEIGGNIPMTIYSVDKAIFNLLGIDCDEPVSVIK